MSIKISIFLLLLVTGFFPVVGMANEDSAKTQELASQIATLKDEVTELKKAVTSLKATQPTITMLMSTFSERFHVMHYAGEAGRCVAYRSSFLLNFGLVVHVTCETGLQ